MKRGWDEHGQRQYYCDVAQVDPRMGLLNQFSIVY